MRDTFAPRHGLTLVKSPSLRQQAARRRLVAVASVLGLAMVSGVIGALAHHPGQTLGRPHTGPFSYFPSE